SLRSRSLGTRPPGATTGPHSCPTTGHQVRTDQNPHGQAHSPDLMTHRGYPEVLDHTGVAPTVTSDGDQTESLTTGGNFKWVLDANSDNAEAAAAFISYALAGDTDVLLPFFVDTQFTKAPAREDVAEAVNADPGAAEAPWSEVITEDVVPYTIGEPLYPWDVNVAMGLAIQQSMMGDVAPADALAEADATIEQIIEREDLPANRAELGD